MDKSLMVTFTSSFVVDAVEDEEEYEESTIITNTYAQEERKFYFLF